MDGATAVADASIQLFVNGNDVHANKSKAGAVTTVSYAPTDFFGSGVKYNVTLIYSDTAATFVTNNWSFTTQAGVVTVPASYAKGAGTGQSAGWSARLSQSTTGTTSTAWTEAQLAGANAIIATAYDLPAVINYWGNSGVGNFGNDTPNFPGLPGNDGDYFAMEMIAYLALDRGVYTFGVNSDDGFRVTIGDKPGDLPPASTVVGEADYGKGVSDVLFTFAIPTNGLYPVRLIFQEGGGGDAVEFFSVNSAGVRILIGDPTNTTTAIKAYRYCSALPQPATIVAQPQNVTVPANENATFTVSAVYNGVTNAAQIVYQWKVNGADIPVADNATANKPTLLVPLVQPGDNNKRYSCAVGVLGYPLTVSAAGQLTVTADVKVPTVVYAQYVDSSHVQVQFSEVIKEDSMSAYTFTPPLTIFALDKQQGSNVVLYVENMALSTIYTLNISGITDMAGNALVTVNVPVKTPVYAAGYVVVNYYLDIGGGTTVADLTGNAKYTANTPDRIDFFTTSDGLFDWADNYGAKMYGYIVPSVSGDYLFHVSSDDASQLWLSSNEDPANLSQIAAVSGWMGHLDWNGANAGGGQHSTAQTLVANQKYYFQVLMKEGGGGDSISVGWTLPGETAITLIPAANLAAPLYRMTSSLRRIRRTSRSMSSPRPPSRCR